jgi:hypothetical protein
MRHRDGRALIPLAGARERLVETGPE